VYPADEVTIEGRKFRPPPYYDAQLKKLCTDEDEKHELLGSGLYDQVIQKRQEHTETLGPTTNNEKRARRAQASAKTKQQKERN
jgi:hypothetical protein